MRVLVVGQGETRSLVDILTEGGAEVIGLVRALDQALRVAEMCRPDIVLIDTRLASRDSKLLRTIQRLSIPVALLVSGSDRAALARQACDSARILLHKANASDRPRG